MVLQILLWLVVAVLVMLALLVSLPVYVQVSSQSDPVRRTTISLHPFGGVSPPLRVFDSTRKRKKRTPKPKPKRTDRKTSKRGRAGGLSPRGNIVVEAVTLLRRVLGAFHIDALRVDAEFGLGDPAETGQVFGQLCPVIYGTGANVTLRPNFNEACLRGSAMARIKVTPIAVAWPFVGFGWRVFGPRP